MAQTCDLLIVDELGRLVVLEALHSLGDGVRQNLAAMDLGGIAIGGETIALPSTVLQDLGVIEHMLVLGQAVDLALLVGAAYRLCVAAAT